MSTNHFLTHAILGWEAKLAVANLLAKEDLSPITGSAQAVLGRPYLHHMPTVIHEVCISFRFCRCNRTENYYFSKCTNLIIFQMKLWLRLLAGKTKYQHIICAVSVAIKSPRTPV